MTKMMAIRPKIEDLLPTNELARAFEEKTAAYEAGRLVRDLRRSASLTQAELAIRLDISQPRISAIESGEGTDGPTFGLLKRIASACGFAWEPRFVPLQMNPMEEAQPLEPSQDVPVAEQQIYHG